MEIKITQKSVTPTFTFDTVHIRTIIVTPFVNARILLALHFIDVSGIIPEENCILNREIVLTTDEYNNWTTDEYLVELVLTKLDLEKQ